MNTTPVLACLAVLALSFPRLAESAITLGLLNDFEDGTTQGWVGGASPTNIANGGPSGAGDRFLQIGGTGSLASFNAGSDFSGAISASVTAFQVDLMRPATDMTSLEIRLGILGPGTGNRWTSSDAELIPNDGIWRTYTFSILESDLLQVLGSGTYAEMISDVNRIKIQHDPAPAGANGEPAPGTLGIDNVRTIPEPAAAALLLGACLAIVMRQRLRPPVSVRR